MSLHQKRTHPTYVPGCFGCQVTTIGYDGKHMTKVIPERTDTSRNTITEHRSGRVDVTVRPNTHRLKISTS